ncbi:MAG: MFS transporter [Spirochaetales bacterium]|nr:MFS transporter [Spirochaetales bacterium]
MHEIIKQKIRLRLLYWVTFFAMGAGVPFLNLYYKQVLVFPDGSPAIELIGLIVFLEPFLGVFSNPLAGMIADKFKVENRLLLLCAFITMIAAGFISIPGFNSLMTLNIGYKVLFIGIGIFLKGLFIYPIVPLINTETLNFLHTNKKDPREYGEYRVMGTLAWIVSTVFIGIMLNLTGFINIPPLILGLGSLVLSFISLQGVKAKIKKIKIPWKYLKKDYLFRRFLIFAFFQAFGLLSAFAFTSYFMDDAKLGFIVIGVSFAVSAVTEVPVMFYSKRIAKKIGNRMMVILGTSVLTLKFILLALLAPLKNPGLTILVMSLHGVGYGLQFNGMLNLVDGYAHKDLRATYMNVFAMIGTSLALSLGGMFCTFIIKILDSTWMLGINSCIVIGAIIYFIFFVKENKEISP